MAEKKKTETGTLKLCLRRSLIGSNRHQRAVVRGLGLTRRLSVVERQDTPEIRGMIRKVSHLVDVVADAGAGDETKERRR